MYGVHKILVGVDIAGASDHHTAQLPPPTVEAVELALQIAKQSQAQLLFFTVTNDAGEYAPDAAAAVAPPVQAVHAQLLADAADLGVAATSKFAAGRAWLEIIQEAIRGHHDLVLIGSRNHRIRELLLGTTGAKLLRKCPCPVWVARPGGDSDVRTVLVANDLTPVGAHCVQLGVSAARLLDARLLIVHAVQYPLEPTLRRTGCPQEELDAYRARQEDDARQVITRHLDQTDHRTLAQGVRVEIAPGPPDLMIEDAINAHQVELLVMGTVARTGIPGLLFGNTAERLLPKVTCSVLAVKPDGFDSPVRVD